MKYAVEMGSVAMIYMPSFVKIGSGDTQTRRQDGDRISLLPERRLKAKYIACIQPDAFRDHGA
jgi:hypothetical protein